MTDPMSQIALDPPSHVQVLSKSHGSDEKVKDMAPPSPPVPAKLREILKDYPDHIEELQRALNSVKDRRIKSTPPFEAAVWLLEDCLDGFISDAQGELTAAQASDDAKSVTAADEKFKLMFRARSGNGGMKGLHELHEYFNTSEEQR